MMVLNYQKKYHKKIVRACVLALKSGNVVAYPTDTSYGLAVDAVNVKAINKLYKVKGRNFNKPVHIIPPSLGYAKKIVRLDKRASKLAKKFWPGALTLVLGLRASASAKATEDKKGMGYRVLSAGSEWLGIRMPKNRVALDLAKYLGRPITTTSANVSGNADCYLAKDINNQFKNTKFKPDLIIDFGKLPKRKPSTVVKITDDQIEILRPGPITAKQIFNAI